MIVDFWKHSKEVGFQYLQNNPYKRSCLASISSPNLFVAQVVPIESYRHLYFHFHMNGRCEHVWTPRWPWWRNNVAVSEALELLLIGGGNVRGNWNDSVMESGWTAQIVTAGEFKENWIVVCSELEWLMVTGTWVLFFHSVGNFIPTDALIFFRGVNFNHQPAEYDE